MSKRKRLTMKYILARVVSFRLSEKNNINIKFYRSEGVKNAHRRYRSSIGYCKADNILLVALLTFTALSYLVLPSVSSSSASYSSRGPHDELDYGSEEDIINRLSRSQLGYSSASHATNPTEMSGYQNEFDEDRDFDLYRTSTYGQKER